MCPFIYRSRPCLAHTTTVTVKPPRTPDIPNGKKSKRGENNTTKIPRSTSPPQRHRQMQPPIALVVKGEKSNDDEWERKERKEKKGKKIKRELK